ncbi:MAG: ferrous iron transport protein A [Faecalicatena sp.]|uniref:FeoA family protein n=1 Tax=Faecalicatena sp. TaxID=2005360 RepID=UPI00258351DC|nr:FeoA family protein [Faecalicatena sp.]MCI6464193.1 ferrous iron transport protein A [Faecalicatena sp.]MDY5621159.1 FeoA family protein [Lachnospiraceae bacterium]
MKKVYSLNDVQPGQKAVIKELRTDGSIHRRLLDIGLVKGTQVECVGKSPGGDPHAFLVRGAVIAIRSDDLRRILIQMPEGA